MDPAAFRAQFPVLERTAYLNAGTDGPVPAAAVQAARAELESELTEGRFVSHFERRFELMAELRAGYAALLGCDVEDVALTTSTSEGMGAVLSGMDLGPGDEIVTSDQEHPGLLGPLRAARERGVAIRMVPLRETADAVGPKTRLVACSHVGWVSGELAPAALADVGVPVLLDGAQGPGAMPIDVRALGCAAYAAAGQKWLCGADGTGMLYLAHEFRERVRCTAPTYLNLDDAHLGIDSPLKPDARRYDTPALSRESAAFSLAALRVLEDAGWDALFTRAHDLAARLAELLTQRGHRVAPRERTTLVAWEDSNPPETVARLLDRGVIVRYLPGRGLLRASVGAWNGEQDLERLVSALA
jgi:L-cysteine/cystine lyase